MSDGHDSGDATTESLQEARAHLARLESSMADTVRRTMTLWVARWAVAMAGAVAIVVFTGQYGWLLLAALGVAAASMAVNLFSFASMRKRVAAAREKVARLEARQGEAP